MLGRSASPGRTADTGLVTVKAWASRPAVGTLRAVIGYLEGSLGLCRFNVGLAHSVFRWELETCT